MTSKQKIDQALGISNGQSIDDFLNGLTLDNTDQLSATIDNIGSEIKDSLNKIDETALQTGSDIQSNSILEMKNLDLSLKEVEDLIGTAKAIFKHVYEQIITTSLVDSELIGSVSKLLESIHINIAEFINLYKDKQRFVEKIKLKMLDQQNKIELLKLRYQLEKEKNTMNVIDVEEGKQSYSYDAIAELLNRSEQDQ